MTSEIVKTHGYQFEGLRHDLNNHFNEGFKDTSIIFHTPLALNEGKLVELDSWLLEHCVNFKNGRDRIMMRFTSGERYCPVEEGYLDDDCQYVSLFAGRAEGRGKDFRKNPWEKSQKNDWIKMMCAEGDLNSL